MSKQKKTKPHAHSARSKEASQDKFGSSLASQLRQVKVRTTTAATDTEPQQLPEQSSSSGQRPSGRVSPRTISPKTPDVQASRSGKLGTGTTEDNEDIDLRELWNPHDESEDMWQQWADTEVQKLPHASVDPHRKLGAITSASSGKTSGTTQSTVSGLKQRIAQQEAMMAEWVRLQEIWQQERQILHQEQIALQQENRVLRDELNLLHKKCDVLEQELAQSTRLHQNVLEQWQRDKEQLEQNTKARQSLEDSEKIELKPTSDPKKESTTPSEPIMTSVATLLTQRAIPVGQENEALQVLASRLAPALLRRLYAEPATFAAWLQKHLVLCCGHPDCEAAYSSAVSTSALLRVQNPALCEHCQGSDAQRAVRQLLRTLRKYQKNKVVIIGGSPDAHAELQRMIPQGFDIRLVDGTDRRFKQQATDDLRYSDLVVIWGPTILSHRTSDLYTQQRIAFPDRMLRVHKRGLAAFARSLCALLEGKEQDSDTEENTE